MGGVVGGAVGGLVVLGAIAGGVWFYLKKKKESPTTTVTATPTFTGVSMATSSPDAEDKI